MTFYSLLFGKISLFFIKQTLFMFLCNKFSIIIFYCFFNKFIYLFMAALGLRCCPRAFSSCREWGLLFVAVCGLLIAVASLITEHGLQARGLSSCGLRAPERRLSSCGTRAQLFCGMWDPPGPGLKPVSPELAGGFLSTVPPGKPCYF